MNERRRRVTGYRGSEFLVQLNDGRFASYETTPRIDEGETVWHYTNESAAESICETNTFRATWYRSLADETEIEYGATLLKSAYVEAKPHFQTSRRTHAWLTDHIDDLFGIRDRPVYVLCGSTSAEVDELRLAYATPGRVLGMPAAAANCLAVLDRSGDTRIDDFNLSPWRRVEYRPERQAYLAACAAWFMLGSSTTADSPDEFACASAALNFVAFVKDPSYRWEQEARYLAHSTAFQRPPCELTYERRDGLPGRGILLTHNPRLLATEISDARRAPLDLSQEKVVSHARRLPIRSVHDVPGQ